MIIILVAVTTISLVGIGYRVITDWFSSYPIDEWSYVSRGYGAEWPLTVHGGKIIRRNEPDRELVLFKTESGKWYGLNGSALIAGYSDIHEITKIEKIYDDGGVLYRDVSRLIQIGESRK